VSNTRVLVLVLAVAACGRGSSNEPKPVQQPLAVFAVQRLTVTPAGYVRGDTSGWWRQGAVNARSVDSALVTALQARDLGQNWLLPPALVASYERNRSYAADPYRLALQPLRSTEFVGLSRYGEPLSTQLRTMIALHEDARLVLVPIELRFEPVGTAARGVLKLALLDPRLAHAVWVGTVEGDAAASPALALASVATKVTDLFIAP
jgi:hypothetical protein